LNVPGKITKDKRRSQEKNLARRVWIMKTFNLRRLSCTSSTAASGPVSAGVPPVVVVFAGGSSRGTFSGLGSVSVETGAGSEGGMGGFSLDGGVETGALVFVVVAGASTLAGC
jgi:hypothetical protein